MRDELGRRSKRRRRNAPPPNSLASIAPLRVSIDSPIRAPKTEFSTFIACAAAEQRTLAV